MELKGTSVVILADDMYEDMELWYPKIRLTEAGAKVAVAGVEKRAYKGHLTLGRMKTRVNPGLIQRIVEEKADVRSEEFTTSRMIFYKSDLRPSGAVYSALHGVAFERLNCIGSPR